MTHTLKVSDTVTMVPNHREDVTSVVKRMIEEAQKLKKTVVVNFNGKHLVATTDSDSAAIIEKFHKSFDRYKK